MQAGSEPLRHIAVIGGGSAGWMAAASLANALQGKCRITLVESDAIGTVGVGEATIPPIKLFNNRLGIAENDFIRETQGSFKLGIQFVDWGRKGHRYFHPFGPFGADFDMVPLHHYWLRERAAGDTTSLDEYSMAWAAASRNRFDRPARDPRMVQSTFDYAYHFDAGMYAAYLRKYAEQRGVVRVEGRIESVARDTESGRIASVTLEDGEVIEAEFWLDCTGFRGLLIEDTLETGYEDWTHWLPCDRAWAVQSDQPGDPLPYTRATAHAAGWQWRVPLQHRLGNGHVFCSKFMSDDDALNILLNNLDGEPTSEPRLLRFVTGHRKKFWNKNVVAIGLSSGFMEPLESTSIHLIHSAINKLMLIFSLAGVEPQQEKIFNRLALTEFRRIRDFLVLHYNATARDDSEFWNYCRTMDVPETLTEKVELFKFNGQIFREEDELFTATSWAAVMLGQGIQPGVYSPLVDALDQDSLLKEVGEMEKSVKYVVYHMPKHKQFLDKYCPAGIPA